LTKQVSNDIEGWFELENGCGFAIVEVPSLTRIYIGQFLCFKPVATTPMFTRNTQTGMDRSSEGMYKDSWCVKGNCLEVSDA